MPTSNTEYPGKCPDFFVVTQCRDCESDPEECTEEMKSTCPFHKIHMEKLGKAIAEC